MTYYWIPGDQHRIVRCDGAWKTTIAVFDDILTAIRICNELNQAAHAAAASTRKESTMKKMTKPVAKPTKKPGKKGC